MNTRPTRAVILAAGLATRLRPLTTRLPKSTLPLWGRPVLHHVLDLLASWQVRDALINLHHEPAQVLDSALAWKGPIRLHFSFEPSVLGTGGALPNAAWFIARHPFWLMNADVAADLDPRPLLRAHARRPHPLATLWVHPSAGPRTVGMQKSRVTSFAASHPGSPGTVTFCGLHLLSPDVLRYLPAQGPASIIDAYRHAMADGRRIAAVTVPGSFWADIGTPDTYLDAHAEIRRRAREQAPGARLYDPRFDATARLAPPRATDRDFAAVAPDVAIPAGVRLRASVVMSGARLHARARLDRAIAGPGATVRGRLTGLAAGAPCARDPELDAALAALGWQPGRTTVLPLPARGSDRAFTRLQTGARSVILIRHGPERAENDLYAGHARFLRRVGLPVPAVLASMPERRLTVMEDLGNRSLEDLMQRRGEAAALPFYEQAIRAAAALHTRGTGAARQLRLTLCPPFSPDLYRWERDYFAEHFLAGRLRLAAAGVRAIRADLETVAARLLDAPSVLIHRDLQSTNLLIVRGTVRFIDFQGMRFGAAEYDLASLLGDPYVSPSPALQERLLALYARLTGYDPAPLFGWAAVQRLAQALGAFARLGAQPATARFAAHIPSALAMMRRALDRTGGLPALRALVDRTLATPLP